MPVFSAILTDGEFFSSQWSVVIGIVLAFFFVQVALSARLYLRTREQIQILARLSSDVEHGGNGRGGLRGLSKNFTWISWVLSIFPAETATPFGNFTRDDVLNELDARIASDSDYLLLQRLGVMAPLLGVILTVVGFYWLKVDESDEQSLQGILLSVTPLISGVVRCTRALAIVNQVLLYGVGGRIESLRMLARTWFDTVIWRSVGLDSPASTAKAIAAIERFTRSVADSAERHALSAGRIEGSTASLRNAASSFCDVVTAFNAEISEMPQTLCDLRKATAASADALEELIPIGRRAVSNLDVSVAAFRTTIDREFAAAAKLHDRSSRVLTESLQKIGDSAQLLKTSSDELKQTARSNLLASQQMDESLRQHLVPGTQHFFDAVNTLTGQIAVWGKVANGLSANVDAMTSQLDKLAAGLLQSVTSICDAVDERVGQAVKENARMHQRQSIESDMMSTQRTMHDAAISFAQSAAQLTDFVERGLGPAIAQFKLLRKTLTELQDTVVTIKDFNNAGDNIDRLTEALSRACEIADAISTLPGQIRDILELSAEDNSPLLKERSGLSSWLSRRPR